MLEAVRYYLTRAQSGHVDEAFHVLRQLTPGTLPVLLAAYRDEDDPHVRAMIMEVIWRQSRGAALGPLSEALDDPSHLVWKQALDGLVSIGSPASLEVLQAALMRARDLEFRGWIEEAIDQLS